MFGALGYLTELNLFKKTKNNFDHLLTPKLLFRYAPDFMRKETDGARLNHLNIFSLDRLNSYNNFENGLSATIGFDYEVKGANFYNGIGEDENNVGLSAPTAAIKGFEYLIHYEKERKRGEEWINSRYFLRHTGDNHIVKLEQREQGNIGFKYQSAEARARLPIGKKFSISAGAIYRTHEKAYGYNPIEIWLNEQNDDGTAANPWYTLGYEYGYYDTYYVANYYDQDGNFVQFPAWFWMDENDVLVAHTDEVFRDEVFPDLMNRYNNDIWDLLDPYGEIAPVVGADFYHYKNKFWMHAYANWILPYHKYLKGDEDFSYLNRGNWGKGGLRQDSTPEQWLSLIHI